jgi:hypothetical protein
MGAALAYGASLIRNPEVALVKLARTVYWSMATLIGLAWYTGWRNERVAKGQITKWPLPGLSRLRAQYPASREDAPLPTAADVGIGGAGSAAAGGGGGNLFGPGGAKAGTIVDIGHYAQKLGLHVGEHPMFGGVHPVHARGSLHYQGRAIDVSGPEGTMQAFASWVRTNYGARILELIHNPGFSMKNGKDVPPSFWGASTWAAHRNHVHVAI